MIAADRPVQRPSDARLLVVDGVGQLTHAPRSRLIDFLQAGDLVVANDAATIPASLHGMHVPTGAAIEARLAGRSSLDADEVIFSAVMFGPGDFRTRTEDRPLPPALSVGDRVRFGSGDVALSGIIDGFLDHPRLVVLRFDGAPRAVWAGIARHGRPIQYAHMTMPLAVWDVWTSIAAAPVAFEAPSAGFALDWQSIGAMHRRRIGFATITVAAGISSTGDGALDRRLPFDEAYRISATAAAAVMRAKEKGARVIAVGTSVVRALEHAAQKRAGLAGEGIADQRIGPDTQLRLVDAILSGTHEPDSSHYQLLRAFMDPATLAAMDDSLDARGYRTHEFGDSVLIERSRVQRAALVPAA